MAYELHGFGLFDLAEDLDTVKYKNWHADLPVGQVLSLKTDLEQTRIKMHSML